MRQWTKISTFFFVLVFTYQLLFMFTSFLFNQQQNFNSSDSKVTMQFSSDNTFSNEILELSNSEILEEVLEEEVEQSKSFTLNAIVNSIDFCTYYIINDYHSILTSDYIPPETNI